MKSIKAVVSRRSLAVGTFAATLSFAGPALAASEHLGQRTLRPGMSGHDVRVLQQYLGFAGFPTAIDGEYGPATERSAFGFEAGEHLRHSATLRRGFDARLRAVVAQRQGTQDVAGGGGAGLGTPSPSAPSGRAAIQRGLAVAPADAPASVKGVIAAANRIAFKPYVYGGGHGSWTSTGYDCSGSVSYALHGGGLLSSTEDSTELESYGSGGGGQWITIWANAGHVYMYVAGLRFDTSAQSSTGGSRWTAASRSNAGFVERHPTGL